MIILRDHHAQTLSHMIQVDFTYIDNVVLAHLLAAEHMVEGSPALGKVYFITNGEVFNPDPIQPRLYS